MPSDVQSHGAAGQAVVIVRVAAPIAHLDTYWPRVLGPFLAAWAEHDAFRAGLVLDGRLAESFSSTHIEALHAIRTLVERDQVELLCTPMYGPPLAGVPAADA